MSTMIEQIAQAIRQASSAADQTAMSEHSAMRYAAAAVSCGLADTEALRQQLAQMAAQLQAVQDNLLQLKTAAGNEIERLRRCNQALVEACSGLLLEWDKLSSYGSPMAKAANERVHNARRAIANAVDRP